MAQEQNDRPNEGGSTPSMTTDITFPPIGEEEQDGAAPETDPVQAQMQKLQEQFEQSQQAFNEERARWQQTVDRLIQTQSAPQRQEPEAPKQQPVDFADLPDPVDKPEDFKRALAEKFEKQLTERMSSSLNQYQQQSSHQQTQQQAFDSMWAKFQQDYADLADKTTTLKGAILSEREAMSARGIDPQQAILADPDGFMKRVADSMRKELGTTGGEPPAPTAPAPEQQANRTGGVGGGTNMSGGGAGKGKKPPSFSEQLKKFQLDSGLL